MNIKELVKIASTISSPSRMSKMLLGQMKSKNPNVANLLEKMMGNGTSPKDALITFAKNGQITKEQVSQLKQYYTIARQMGLKLNIPNKVFIDAENIIEKVTNKSNSNNGF